MATLERIKKERDLRVNLYGTPPAGFLNAGDIDAESTNGAGWVIDFTEETKTKRYYPFDEITINNNSGSDLAVYVNQRRDWKKIVRANVVTKISDFTGIRTVRISKVDPLVTITASEVEVNVERTAFTDDKYRRKKLTENPVSRFIKNKFGFGD